MTNRKQSLIEQVFENILWNSRFIVILAVVFGLIGAFTLFIVGSVEIYHTVIAYFQHTHSSHSTIVVGIIGAIDLYLIGVVALIFSFGLYELFISNIDVAHRNENLKILDITSLDDLKNRVLKVIIMVLIVSYFKMVLSMEITEPLDLLYLALSIFAVSLGAYFMNKK
ncbi:MAG: hypothetical protein ACI9F2_000006 [Lysobacterales bacterium]|jgi:uncharacterized protein (TIGR00645 family)